MIYFDYFAGCSFCSLCRLLFLQKYRDKAIINCSESKQQVESRDGYFKITVLSTGTHIVPTRFLSPAALTPSHAWI